MADASTSDGRQSLSDLGAIAAGQTPDAVVARATQMVREGAAVLDVGGESTRPGSSPVSAGEQIARGVGVGGVLEPAQAAPVVIEDDAFIGSRSMVVEGARVHRGAKLGAGAILTASTHVVDADTGEEYARGQAPARAVCVSSTRVKSFPGGDFGMPVLLVLRTLREDEIHDKLALNEALREHGVAP